MAIPYVESSQKFQPSVSFAFDEIQLQIHAPPHPNSIFTSLSPLMSDTHNHKLENDSSEETQTKMSTEQLESKLYGECRRNHSASIGRYAVDGCGEFFFSGHDTDTLLCAACGCHRNFHRKLGAYGAAPLSIIMAPDPPVTKIREEMVEMRRRKRTKFTEEQKCKMRVYANEKLGWKVQKHDDGEIDEFCNSVGISRRVFKVWLSNNKNKKDGAI